MGRNSGGVRTGSDGGGNYRGKISNVESLTNMKDPQLYRETKKAISRYHAIMGVRQKNIKLADLSASAIGVHVTKGGVSDAVYLNKRYYNKSYRDFIKGVRERYDSSWSTRTNKPSAHTVTHELAHATWNTHLQGANQRAATKEIRPLYRKWKNDRSKKGYGKYAHSNVNEFWAETSTKAVHGVADKYTREVKRIIKKYKL